MSFLRRCPFPFPFAWLGLLAVLFVVAPAAAQSKVEAAALALDKKAMEQDYLVSEFGKAQDKLERAIAQCGNNKCSSPTRARLRRDMGVIHSALGQRERSINSFFDAIQIDPATTLDPDTRTKDLDAAFAEAKRRAGGGSPSGTAPPVFDAPGQPQGGDFEHTPVAAQQIRTAVPVYAEYSGQENLVRVIVRYKGAGMTDFKPIELKRIGDKGWGVLLPCADVQLGTMLYYLQGYNANDHVATSGDRVTPFRVPIKNEAVADPPHLPNEAAPPQCTDAGDCPPGMPGCKKAGPVATSDRGDVTDKAIGEACDGGAECKSNRCEAGKCVDPEAPVKKRRFWIGLGGAIDFTFVPSSDDVCKLNPSSYYPVNRDNYYCVRPDGSDYPVRANANGQTENDAIVPSSQHGSDKVEGGAALGNIRILIDFDYALSGNFLLGARLGFVLLRYPGAAAGADSNRFGLPIHGEVRATYVLGRDAVYREGFAPYFFAAAGIAPFETRIGVQTIETKTGAAPTKQDIDSWLIAGPIFGAFGGGGRWLVAQNVAITFGGRANFAFLKGFAPSIGPEFGVQLGY